MLFLCEKCKEYYKPPLWISFDKDKKQDTYCFHLWMEKRAKLRLLSASALQNVRC